MDKTPFFQPFPSDYICELHNASATCFLAHEDGSASFYCPGCQPKDQTLLQDCHPVEKFKLFKALKNDSAQLRKRKEHYTQGTCFLSALYLRHSEVQDQSQSLIEQLYTVYTKSNSLRAQVFDSLYHDLKHEVETVYDKPVYRLTNLGKEIVLQGAESGKKVAMEFFNVQLGKEIEAFLPRLDSTLHQTRPAYYKSMHKDLYSQLHSLLPTTTVPPSFHSIPLQDEYTGEYNSTGQRHGYGSCVYRNGDRYTGEWRFDQRNGLGKQVYSNGNKYKGAWEIGEMQGYGCMKWRNGLEYCGKFKHNEPASRWQFWKYGYKGIPLAVVVSVLLMTVAVCSGVYVGFDGGCTIQGREYAEYADGYYHGEYLNSQRHGEGTFLWPSGAVYVGSWVSDQRHGPGLFINSTRNWHMGDFQYDSFYQGRSGIFMENGDFYIGESKQGERFGQGFYFAANGTVYAGSWAKDLITGIGASPTTGFFYTGNFSGSGFTLMSHENGEIYIGQAYAGKRQGKGILLWPNGDFHSGSWDNHQQSGPGIFYSQETCLVGTFQNGTFDTGFGTKEFAGDQYYGEFTQGQRHGQGVLVAADGYVLTGSWNADTITGPGLRFLPNGGFEQGYFKSSRLDLGSGLIFYNNSEVYYGEIRDGIRRGSGTYVGKNWTYSGEWRDHMPQGKGFKSLPNGDFQQGRFQNGGFAQGIMLQRVGEGEFFYGNMSLHGYHGRGVRKWGNDTLYVGDWYNGKMHGSGLFAKSGKMIYDGGFANGNLTQGNGLITLPNGEIYFGSMNNSDLEGTAHYIWGNHSAYFGEWKAGKKHGHGLSIEARSGFKLGNFSENEFRSGEILQLHGDIYYGGFANGSSGQGVYAWNNGAVYMGEWVSGLMEGYGMLIRQNRSVERGLFRNNNLQSGELIQQYSEGKTYIGDILHYSAHGSGLMLDSDGTIYSGNWQYGSRFGSGLLTYPNLDFLVGNFTGLVLDSGHALFTYSNGDKFYGEIQHGERVGCGAYLWQNGSVYSGQWTHDAMTGSGLLVVYDNHTCAAEIQQSTVAEHAAFTVISLLLWLSC